MKYIAFKKAGSIGSLHKDYIVEFADTSLFPKDFHKNLGGYEILPEEKFNELLSKNQDLHNQHLETLRNIEISKQQAIQAEEEVKRIENSVLEREFEEFKRWKKSLKNKLKKEAK